MAVGLVPLVALLAPGVATADPQPESLTNTDTSFLRTLDYYGITYTSANLAIAAGHAVCADLDNGLTPNQTVNDLWLHSSLDATHAEYFVGDSMGAYCPQYAYEIGT